MKMKQLMHAFLMTTILLLSSSGALFAKTLDSVDRAFYDELSCQAKNTSVLALIEKLAEQNVSQLQINKFLTDILITPGLIPGSPRWTCCRACVENDLPNSSAACQCCDGLGMALSPLLERE